jgi:predicted acylesterase/phospholipase RssA
MCVRQYLEFSESVFRVDRKMLVPVGEGYCRFSPEPLDKALKKVVFNQKNDENTPLADESDKLCPVFVIATPAREAGHIRLFRSYGFRRNTCPIWEAARATTAAPTYFPPAWVTVPHPPEQFIDGGVTQNNPSPIALKEGKELLKAKRCLLVSVGTGFQKRADFIGNRRSPKYDPQTNDTPLLSSQSPDTPDTPSPQPSKPMFDKNKTGLLQKAALTIGGALKVVVSPFQPVADKAAQAWRFPGGLATAARFAEQLVKLSTESEKTHRTINAEVNSKDASAQFQYYRFNVQRGMDEIGLEEWDNWDLIVTLTRNYLEDSADVLAECAKDLLHPPGFESK